MTELNVRLQLARDISEEVAEKMGALEESLMRYHHEKMREINQTLADFWRMTYQGTDIDSIQIMSDVEKSSVSSRVANYNYRIVMLTGDE